MEGKTAYDLGFEAEVFSALEQLEGEKKKIKTRWLPGMLWKVLPELHHPSTARILRVMDDHTIWATVEDAEGGSFISRPWHYATPDLDDHATVGCLHALAEEAYGKPLSPQWVNEFFYGERVGGLVRGPLLRTRWLLQLFSGTSSQTQLTAETRGKLWATVLVHLARI